METKPKERPGFTASLWRSSESIYRQILRHPFLTGLADGSLPRERFHYYVLQDGLYLREYARVLSMCGARSQEQAALLMFNEHAAGTVAVERGLHEDLLNNLGVAPEQYEETEASPTTLAYTSFLLRTAVLGDYLEVLGAILPCYWIYWEVGKTLRERGSRNPLYQKWIDTYAGEEFGSLVGAVLDLTDRACEHLDAAQKARVTNAFVVASRYEWMFWDAAWRLEGWPVR